MADKKLMVVVGANISDFQKKMNETIKTLNRMSKDAQKSFGPIMDAIGTGLKAAGTAAATGFGALVAGSVKGASSLEQYRNTLNVVMKDQQKAAETMAWAVDFANKTPFDTTSIVDATVKLQSYGVTAKDVMPQIGNMAAVMNKDINQAVEAVADAQTGELERLKEFGITKSMIVEEGNRIMRGKELVNAKGQIVDQENFNKALFSLMDQRFKGGMEIQANSFKGLWSTVTGTLSTTLATLAGISATGEIVAGGLFDNVKNKIKDVVGKLEEWQKNGKLQEWAGTVQSAFSAMWGVAETVVNGLVTGGKFIYDNWNVIEPIVAGIVAGFLAFKTVTAIINTAKIAMAAFNLIMNLNPIGIIVLAIGALVAVGITLYKNWDTIKAKAGELWNKIKETFDGIKASVGNLWAEAKEWGANIVRGIGEGISGMAEWIKDKVLGFCNKISTSIKDFFGIASPSKLMTMYGQYVAQGLADGIESKEKEVVEKAEKLVKSLTDSLKKLGFNEISEVIDKNLLSLTEWVNKVGNLGRESASIAKGLSSRDKEKVYDSALVLALSQQYNKTGTIKINNGVPQFGDGGKVPGSIGSPQLILAHGGETVLPTHKRSYGGVVSIIMNNNISSDYDVDRLGEQLVRTLRRKGVLVGV